MCNHHSDMFNQVCFTHFLLLQRPSPLLSPRHSHHPFPSPREAFTLTTTVITHSLHHGRPSLSPRHYHHPFSSPWEAFTLTTTQSSPIPITMGGLHSHHDTIITHSLHHGGLSLSPLHCHHPFTSPWEAFTLTTKLSSPILFTMGGLHSHHDTIITHSLHHGRPSLLPRHCHHPFPSPLEVFTLTTTLSSPIPFSMGGHHSHHVTVITHSLHRGRSSVSPRHCHDGY